MKYFSLEDTEKENREMFLFLSKRYHPDNIDTGNEDMMKEINAEWDVYKNTDKSKISKAGKVKTKRKKKERDEQEPEGFQFRGRKYYGTQEQILEQVALQFGGMTLMEFVHSKEWREYTSK